MPDVRMPDGTVIRNVPEGTTRAQLMARVSKAKAAPAPAKQAKPKSFLQGVGEGILTPFNNAARALETGAEKIGIAKPLNAVGEFLGMAPSVQAAERTQQQTVARSPYRGSGAGKFVGNIVGTLPTAAIPGGILAQGAAGGALLTNARNPQGVLTDAAIGAAAGKVGEKAMRGIANIVSPRVAPVVQRLKAQGVKMTPGQILGANDTAIGRMAKATEDRVAGLPLIGDMVSAARRRSVESFNKAALNEPLKSIGKSLPDNVGIGHDAIRHVERTLGQAYDDVLPRLAARADDNFYDDLARISSEAQTMLPQRADQLSNIMNADVRRFFKPDGTIDGKGLKAIETRLGQRIRNYAGGADPDARDLANALQGVQASIRDMAARQNPKYAPQLRKINEGWAKFIRTQRAAAGAKEGVFTPGQLRTATRVSDSSGRKAASARGEALMQQLAEDAQSVLPSAIPDSGTAGRAALGLGLGGAGYFSPGAALAGGAAVLPYTKAGGKAAEWLLTGRQGQTFAGLADLFRALGPQAAIGSTALTAQ